MNRKIYKYEIGHGTHHIPMPKGAKIVSVGSQRDAFNDEIVFVWAEVEDGNATERRVFTLYATGQPISSPYEVYVGTAFLHDRQLVFHVYEATI
jgi:hypothetical protein